MTVQEALKASKSITSFYKKSVIYAQSFIEENEQILCAITGNFKIDGQSYPGVTVLTDRRIFVCKHIVTEMFFAQDFVYNNIEVGEISGLATNRLPVTAQTHFFVFEGTPQQLKSMQTALLGAKENAPAPSPESEQPPVKEPEEEIEESNPFYISPENLIQMCPECGDRLLGAAQRCPTCGNKQLIAVDKTDTARIEEVKANATNQVSQPNWSNAVFISPKAAAKAATKSRIKDNKANAVACCPKCGSTSLSGHKKGFGIGKAVVGTAAAVSGFGIIPGALGLTAGNLGAKKIRVTCLNCGHHWWAGKK